MFAKMLQPVGSRKVGHYTVAKKTRHSSRATETQTAAEAAVCRLKPVQSGQPRKHLPRFAFLPVIALGDHFI
ncbi:hypothetical protein CVE36_24610, partial [Pseudomonas syringae pv. actinidiae]|nr:hypothetical protein [Pseudomonas syringae pv. actinidiae]